jgi:diphthamide biosynthesis protein 7
MGITCYNPNPLENNYFVSGSYDEHIKLWDIRKLAPRNSYIADLKLGGGVWRAKHHYAKNLVACACMHENFQIVEIENYTTLSNFSRFLTIRTKINLQRAQISGLWS